MQARGDATDAARRVRRHACCTQMRPHRYAHAAQCWLAPTCGAVGDAAGDRVFLGYVVGEFRRRLIRRAVDAIDRDPFALCHLTVEMPPVRCEIRAECQTRHHLQIAHLQHVAGHGIGHMDRAGHDMHAWRPIMLGDRGIKRTNIGIHHQIRRVTRMMRDGFGANEVAALHVQSRRQ
jgi:hypothetical protein